MRDFGSLVGSQGPEPLTQSYGRFDILDPLIRELKAMGHEVLLMPLARILWAMMKTGESFRTEMFAKA